MCFPFAQKRNKVGEAELFRITKWKSCIETLPAPAPVPWEDAPNWDAPQENDSISTSPPCCLSFDSPFTSVSFRNMSTAICSSFYCYLLVMGERTGAGDKLHVLRKK